MKRLLNLNLRRQAVIAVILAAFSLVALLSPQASAQTKPSVTISPFLQDIRIQADEPTKDFKVGITNNSSDVQTFSLSVLDFGSLDESGGVVFEGSKASSLLRKYGLSTWLQLSSKTVTVDPGKKVDVTATIINDTSLQPGGHYAAVVATVIDRTPRTDEIDIDQKLSSLVLATKVGGEHYDLRLDSIEASNGTFSLPRNVTLKFHNPGNVHVVPRGRVTITAPSGKVVSQGAINEDSSFVLPETSRRLFVEMHSIGSIGIFPGVYHIEVDYRYDGIEKFAHKSQNLFFLNLTAIVVALLVLVIFVWLFWGNRHHLKRLKRGKVVVPTSSYSEHKRPSKKI